MYLNYQFLVHIGGGIQMPKAKLKEKAEAIRLRINERLSQQGIASRLGVSVGSVSLWVRDYPLHSIGRVDSTDGPCSVEDCGKKCYARGMCRSHYDKTPRQRRVMKVWCDSHVALRRLARRRSSVWNKHGITLEQKEQRIKDQGGQCANPRCRRTEHGNRNWNTDHDHVTGQLRGELCHGCNCALGLLNDDIERILGLVDYLKSYKVS